MIFSRASEYAIQAMLFLTKYSDEHGNKLIQTKEIAEAHDIPYHFLAKIVQDLSKANLIKSSKGPFGGVRLAQKAQDISVLDVVHSVDNIQYVTDCVVGYEKCNAETPCPLHYEWDKIRLTIFKLIRDKTLADLVKNTTFENGRLLISNMTNLKNGKTAKAVISKKIE